MTKFLLFATLIGFTISAQAHERSIEECTEAGEFIFHAAQSRDNRMTRQEFVDQFEYDLIRIQQFPPHLRWFVEDKDDEDLLRKHVHSIWDSPTSPYYHQQNFLVECIKK